MVYNIASTKKAASRRSLRLKANGSTRAYTERREILASKNMTCHPPAYDSPYGTTRSASSITFAKPIRLQQTLTIPQFGEIDKDTLWKMYPEFDGALPNFVRQVLKTHFAPAMHLGVTSTVQNFVQDRLASTCKLPTIIHGITPTHVFAIPSVVDGRSRVTLYPIHELILAANCTRLPTLPPSEAAHSESASEIPFVFMPLPSQYTFPILMNYLYTKNKDTLRGSVLRVEPTDSDELKLVRRLNTIKNLYTNAYVLGYIEVEFYELLSALWKETTEALVVQSPNFSY